MTDQESNSSSPQESKSSSDTEIIHAKLYLGVGVLGTKDDVQRFTELMVVDFNNRASKCAQKIFKGRIQVLPPDLEIPEDIHEADGT